MERLVKGVLKMIKKYFALILVIVMCLSSAVSIFAEEDMPVELELSIEATENPVQANAYVWRGELFLPLRAVYEAIGFEVQWFQDNREIKIFKEGKNSYIYLNEGKAELDGHEFYLNSVPRFVKDRTYIREDFFSINLGLEIIWDKEGNSVSLERIEENPITITNKKEKTDTPALTLIIQYPEISGMENTEAQNKINTKFAELAAAAKAKGQEAESLILPEQLSRGIKAEAYFNYEVKYNKKGLVSIVFYDYLYSGGAHGYTVQSSYTYDLKTGAEAELKDLFSSDTDYMSLINGEIKKQMEEGDITMLLAPFSSIKENQDFYLSNKGLVIYFQLYEYYPYVYGIPEYMFEFQSVKDILNPHINLLNCTKSV